MGIFEKTIFENRDEELPYLLYMAKTGCIGIKSYRKLQSYFRSPKAFYMASLATIKKTGIFTEAQLMKIVKGKNDKNLLYDYERMVEQSVKIIPIEDGCYPKNLKQIKDPPPILFLKGKLPDASNPSVAVVGARECSNYGAVVASRLGELFAATDISLISGMARGVDSISQLACVKAGGYSLAFLGGGVDICYPRESRSLYELLGEKGGILSEFAPGTEPMKSYFAMRNRLISGISDVICVVEARERSGTMITVDCGLDQGREIFAVPGRITDITNFGTNELIRQGAGIISDLDSFVDEIVNRYSKNGENKTALSNCDNTYFENLTGNEIAVLAYTDENSFTVGEMSIKTEIPSYELMGICVTLSGKGVLNSLGAGRFAITGYGLKLKNHICKIDNNEE